MLYCWYLSPSKLAKIYKAVTPAVNITKNCESFIICGGPVTKLKLFDKWVKVLYTRLEVKN